MYIFPRRRRGLCLLYAADKATVVGAVTAPPSSNSATDTVPANNYGSAWWLRELFSEVGDHKRYSVHYDRSGRSEVINQFIYFHNLEIIYVPQDYEKRKVIYGGGTTEIVFARREDVVFLCRRRYNNFQLDGKPLKIEIVGTNIAMSLLENLTMPINYTKRIGM
ncbi:hypothetical protein OIU78_000776 [Salix suchowensis]|nr:hypothetical protein OIU78_000776 [Salix suchowensis]